MTEPAGRVVLVTGAAGSAGAAAVRTLQIAGATVVAVGRSRTRLSALAERNPGITTEVADLTEAAAVDQLAQRVHNRHGSIDGLIHLVGGYRGGKTFGSNTNADWSFLAAGLIGTLRNVTLAFHDDLILSTAGRAVIVSATAAASPTAGSANYAAAKAAAEAWMFALADSLQRAHTGTGAERQSAAATVFVIKALVDDAMRAAAPERTFPGFTEVDVLAARIVGLWSAPANVLNGARIRL